VSARRHQVAEAVYRGLLRFLPRPFRGEASADLVATFRAAHARAISRGLLARLSFWPRTLADVLVTAVAERQAARRQVIGQHATRPGVLRRLAADLVGDCAIALRTLARAPGFGAAAIATFALGIGANIAVLAVVDRMMFRPLPYGEADRLVHLHNGRRSGVAIPETYLPALLTATVRARTQTLEDISVAKGNQSPLAFEGQTRPLVLDAVSANLLRVLRVRPIAGRDFVAEDASSESRESVILLTDEAWQRRFGRSPEVLTRVSLERGSRIRVVGILPRGFLSPASTFPGQIDGIRLERWDDTDPAEMGPSAIGRLRPGATLSQAGAEVAVLLKGLAQEHRDSGLFRSAVTVQPARHGLFFAFRPYVWLVLTGVSAVFLIGCVNLATLLLARGRSREHVAAIQAALGASRSRILRASLAESVVVCAIGALIASVACYWTFDAILALTPAPLRGVAASPLDGRLVITTVVTALSTALLAGSPPAIRASSVDVLKGLARDSRSTGGRLRGSATLLAVEAAFGVLLVAGAATTVRSFLGLQFKNPGYEARDLYETGVNHGFRSGDTRHRPERVQGALDLIRSAPGVAAAGAVSVMPVGHSVSSRDSFWRARGTTGMRLGVSGAFFAATGTPILAGREFSDDEVNQSAPVAIVNTSGVSRLWPGSQPVEVIGRSVITADGPRTVVGVVADWHSLPGYPLLAGLFVPITAPEIALPSSAFTAAIRMAPGRQLDVPEVDARLQARLDDTPRGNRLRLSAVAGFLPPHLQTPRFQAFLFGAIALIGLLLTAVGLYAVAAFDVAQRRFELGVRLTMGATAADIRQLVIRRALRPVLIGSAAGLVATWWAARYIQGFLFEVDAHDPWTLGLVALVLIITAVVAVWLPARRAARTDPTAVLRTV
jgi:putative ABC transport system permease protein